MVIDKYGNSYVSGDFRDIYEEDEFVTMKFSSAGGMFWRRVYYSNGKDRAHSNAVDNLGNVYATGIKNMAVSYSDIMTIKYNSNGDTLWVRIFTQTTNSKEESYSIALDDSMNVYVAGFSNLPTVSNGFDYTLIKYDQMGNLEWYRTYDSPYNGDDLANSVRVDKEGFIYVSGTSWGNLMTVKFDRNGNVVWERIFEGADTPDMELDSTGSIYLTARSYYLGGDDFVTLKYTSDGILQWASRYNRFGINGTSVQNVEIKKG